MGIVCFGRLDCSISESKVIGVYTALFGPYDKVLEPRYRQVPFILFTDQDMKSDGWQVKQTKRPHPDARYASRFFFDQSCYCMPQFEYTIMHGAKTRLTMPPAKIVEYLPDNIDIACFAHPHRRTVYEEARACIGWRKDKPEVIKAQMARYRQAGFPKSFGLSACILLVRRNTQQLRDFEDMWWNEVKNGSCRDQLSFDYCRWKTGMEVAYLPGNLFKSPMFRVGRHGKRR